MFLDGGIPLEDYAALTAQEPQAVISQLMEILEGFDDRFTPSVTLRNMLKSLAEDFDDISSLTATNVSMYDTKMKVVDTFRKTVATQHDMERTKRFTELDVSALPKAETTDIIIKRMLDEGMCPSCKMKLLMLMDSENLKLE